MLVGLWGISTLPLSLTASGWQYGLSNFWLVWPFLIFAHAMLLAGYVRHALRPSNRIQFEDLDLWARNTYPSGISLSLIVIMILGITGFENMGQISTLLFPAIAIPLGGLVLWILPRLSWVQSPRAHWVQPANTTIAWLDWLFRAFWNLYRTLGRISIVITSILESDGGIIWTLLFYINFKK